MAVTTNRASCKALYRKRLAALVKPLAHLGVHVTVARLVELYATDQDRTLRPCVDLTPGQRACVEKQASPLLASQACRLDTPLGLPAPRSLIEALAPKPVPVPRGAAKGLLASLVGTWVYEDKSRRRKVKIVIGPGGAATLQRFRRGQPDGPPVRSTLESEHRLELLLRRGATTLWHVFFPLGKRSFALSGNRLHNVIRLPDRKSFRLLVAADRVLVLADGRCHVVDLGHLTTHQARCHWTTDERTQGPELRIEYRLGRWKINHRYVLVQGHLLHQHLLERRYVRQ